METHNEKFYNALVLIADQRKRQGIGTLSESPIHSCLKFYIEPNRMFHEQKVGSFIADILLPFVSDNGILSVEGHIYEIQTAQAYRLIPKLTAFLKLYEVTVVLPVLAKKSCYAFDELYDIKRFLLHPNLRVQICMLEVNTIKVQEQPEKADKNTDKNNGKKTKKTVKKSIKKIKIPTALTHEIIINNPLEYSMFLPKDLPDHFTSKDFAKCEKVNIHLARRVLNVLFYVKVIEKVEKAGNLIVYKRQKFPSMQSPVSELFSG